MLLLKAYIFDIVLLVIPLILFAWTGNWMALLFPLWWLVDVATEVAWLKSVYKRGGTQAIYFFADRGQLLQTVKIGRAKNVVQRLNAHRTAAPFDIKVFLIIKVRNSVAAEREIHERYKPLRIRTRNEWFYLPLWFWLALTLARLTHFSWGKVLTRGPKTNKKR